MKTLKAISILFITGILVFLTSCNSKGDDISLISFTLDKPSVTLTAVGDAVTITATPLPGNATVNFTWTSNDKTIATVSKIGDFTAEVTAVADGETTITIKSGSAEKTVSVKVGGGKLTVIYSENFGNTAVQTGTQWPLIADYTGYEKGGIGGANVVYKQEVGGVSVRGNSVSNYEGASGNCNVMMAAAGANFIINDIATCGAKNLLLSFGNNVTSEICKVYYRIYNTNDWIELSYEKTDDRWAYLSDLEFTVPEGTNTISIKFTAVATQYGVRIDDIKLTTSDQTSSPIIDKEQGGGGDVGGTEDNPYNVTQAIANQGASKWVEGYIVGYVNGMSASDAAFGVPTEAQTEILIAASATETKVENCLPVQLPAGAIRTGLEIFANPTNLGKSVKLYGSLEAYFGQPGMRNTSYYELEGGTAGGSKPSDTGGAILNETFATNQGNFTIVNVTMPSALTYVWFHNAEYKQMAAGAYKDNTNHATEAWLISPAIDLSKHTKATFTFEHAGKQFDAPVSNLTIQVSSNYTGGDIDASNWTALNIPEHLAGETNTFKSAGDIDLTSYCGQSNVHIAFKYTSTTSGAGNWYVRNVVVK